MLSSQIHYRVRVRKILAGQIHSLVNPWPKSGPRASARISIGNRLRSPTDWRPLILDSILLDMSHFHAWLKVIVIVATLIKIVAISSSMISQHPGRVV